jgi:membrane associated rhomboid family serine protease
MATSWMNRSVPVLGQRVPLVVVSLISAILGMSILAAVSKGAGFPLLMASLPLVPVLVLRGFEVWRLVSWPFLGVDGINLLFGCYALWWCSADLARAWGGARFLRVSFGIVALAALGTCLLSLVFPALQRAVYIGPWPLACALIIAWSSLTPYGVVQLFMILPIPARRVPMVWIAFTVVVALVDGIGGYVPHLLAEGLVLLYLRDYSLRNLWLRIRYANIERSLRRRTSPLREVKREDNKPRWFH